MNKKNLMKKWILIEEFNGLYKVTDQWTRARTREQAERKLLAFLEGIYGGSSNFYVEEAK